MSARFTVQWTQTAVDDLLNIIDYVGERDEADAAERLYGQIIPAVADLATMPFRCRVVPGREAEGIDGYRELLVGPYRLMFAVRGMTSSSSRHRTVDVISASCSSIVPYANGTDPATGRRVT